MRRSESVLAGRERETSAGGVVFRRRAGAFEVALGEQSDRLTGNTMLRLPKGKRESGESLEAAAVREVKEETGLAARIVGELETIRYEYQQDGRLIDKSVHFYLMELASDEVTETDGEMTRTVWHPPEAAERLLSFDTERRVMAEARTQLLELES